MDRVFSVDDIADQFWSQPPPPISLPIRLSDDDSSISGSGGGHGLSKMMNRSSSEWAFQRFLQEASASVSASASHNSQSTTPPPPPSPPVSSSGTAPHDVLEIKQATRNHSNDSRTDQNKNNSFNSNQSVKDGKIGTPSFGVGGGGPPPNIPIDSQEYQAFLKSRLDLACAAVALTRVISEFRNFIFLAFYV
ncbi:hypothetical protein M9H77_07847 [Catharanthus roseus]|uniref:Uncharacterized protein n=1 Tax=Catharanthus roseus TaxID=4058 RepID=A0ACC0BW20_CATRO|nr:hypothetical protein M9H77_07847 [Catharanthus roseus]